MADKIIEVYDQDAGTTIPVKYHDNGDGTYSEVVSLAGGGSSSTWTAPWITKHLEPASNSFNATNLSGSGSEANDARRLILNTGATAGSVAEVYWDWTVLNGWPVFNGTVHFAWAGYLQIVGTDFDSFIGVGSVSPTGSSMDFSTHRHFGFRRRRTASGNIVLTCTQSDGTAESSTVVTDPGDTEYCFFGAIKTATGIDYYVNGVKVATITTHIPSGNTQSQPMDIALCNVGVASQTNMYTFDFTYSQQYA